MAAPSSSDMGLFAGTADPAEFVNTEAFKKSLQKPLIAVRCH
jgi:hypothetical protein